MSVLDTLFEKVERRKARELRKSRWWQNKIHQSPECRYCGTVLESHAVTMDHIVPISRGGKSTKGNIAISCKACNTKKRASTPVDLILSL